MPVNESRLVNELWEVCDSLLEVEAWSLATCDPSVLADSLAELDSVPLVGATAAAELDVLIDSEAESLVESGAT